MKRTLCAVFAFILALSFAGCSKKDTESIKEGAPKISDMKIDEKFRSSDGTVSFVIKGTVPEIKKGCDEDVALMINLIIGEYVDEIKGFGEKNADNAGKFMETNNSENPWTRTIEYEVTYADSNVVCMIIKDGMTLNGGEPSLSYKTFCFDLKYGRRLSALDFSKETEEPLRQDMNRFISKDVNKYFYSSGENPTSEQLNKVEDLIDFSSFYIDAENIYFYFPKSGIDSVLSGIYISALPLSKVSNYFIAPGDYLPDGQN